MLKRKKRVIRGEKMGKRNYEVFVGYTIYNPEAFGGVPVVASDGTVYFYLKDARRVRNKLAREFDNPDLEVVKLERVV
jgi:hypothetical protein